MPSSNPLVAIVGRPNVGKSTLFNRLVGSRQAITDAASGTTRDRLYAHAQWRGKTITLIDTGGLLEESGEDDTAMTTAVNEHVKAAIAEADTVMLVTDASTGPVAADRTVAEMIRRYRKPTVLVANKADNTILSGAAAQFFELGLGEPLPVSALHGRATGDLLDRLVDVVPAGQAVSEPASYPRVALVGRANVGKSTLFNRFAGKALRITNPEPHTTRDTGRAVVETVAGPLELIDTAGVLRRGKSGRGMPKYSLLRTLRAVGEADVAVLVIDGLEGPTVQDAHIAAYILEAGTAIVVAVNKWDLVEKAPDIQEKWYAMLHDRLGFLPSPPVLFLSGLTGEKFSNLAEAVHDVWKLAATKVETRDLNQTLRGALPRLPAGKRGKQAPKLYYATQVDSHPPTFLLFVNKAELWNNNHRRYLQNVLRERYGLLATPIVLRFQAKQPREVAA